MMPPSTAAPCAQAYRAERGVPAGSRCDFGPAHVWKACDADRKHPKSVQGYSAKDGQPLAGKNNAFTFDNVFDRHCTTADVYARVGKRIVGGAMDGINGTVFAYGQTSAGKTFSMRGSDDGKHEGMLQMAVDHMFRVIDGSPGRQYLMRVSYVEIYNEVVRDLLADQVEVSDARRGTHKENVKLKIREDPKKGFFVNAAEKMIACKQDILDAMNLGEKQRHVGSTNMNARSSRSHTIFTIVVESRNVEPEDADDEEEDEILAEAAGGGGGASKPRESTSDFGVLVGKLNLVDLAGSENAKASGAQGTRLKEGANINKSLLTLSRVINQVAMGKDHVNFRDS